MANREDTYVAQRIREARAEAGLTQQELAYETGVSLRGVQMWEQSARIPRMDGLAALAAALDKPVAFFFPEPEREAAA